MRSQSHHSSLRDGGTHRSQRLHLRTKNCNDQIFHALPHDLRYFTTSMMHNLCFISEYYISCASPYFQSSASINRFPVPTFRFGAFDSGCTRLALDLFFLVIVVYALLYALHCFVTLYRTVCLFSYSCFQSFLFVSTANKVSVSAVNNNCYETGHGDVRD